MINVLACSSLSRKKGPQNVFTHLNIHIYLSLYSSEENLISTGRCLRDRPNNMQPGWITSLSDAAFLSIKKKNRRFLGERESSVLYKPGVMALCVPFKLSAALQSRFLVDWAITLFEVLIIKACN